MGKELGGQVSSDIINKKQMECERTAPTKPQNGCELACNRVERKKAVWAGNMRTRTPIPLALRMDDFEPRCPAGSNALQGTNALQQGGEF